MKTTLSIAEENALKITYGALVFVFSGIIAFTVWMTTLQIGSSASAATISKIEVGYAEMYRTLVSIDKRLDRIEQLLKPNKGE